MKRQLSFAAALAVVAEAQDATNRLVDLSQNVSLIKQNSPTASMNWTMSVEVSIRQKTKADFMQLHFKYNIKNARGTEFEDYSYLPDNCMLQTWLQIRNDEETDALGEDYLENFVTSWSYFPSDLGKVPLSRIRYTTSCGKENLGLIDGVGYTDVQGYKLPCGFYEVDSQEYYIMNSTRKGVEFRSAFQRRFIEPPL